MVPCLDNWDVRCDGWLVDLEFSVQLSRRWESGVLNLNSGMAAFGHGLLGLAVVDTSQGGRSGYSYEYRLVSRVPNPHFDLSFLGYSLAWIMDLVIGFDLRGVCWQ